MNPPAQQNTATKKSMPLPRLSERAQLILVVAVALVCGLAASVATFRFLKEREHALGAGPVAPPTVSLVVARENLEQGAEISLLNLETAEWPRDHQPPSSFTSMDGLIGRRLNTKVFRGDPITEARLSSKDGQSSLQIRIPDGMLAMSLNIDPEIGVSGFIESGNHVDVVATIKMPRGEPVSKVVLQNLLVLAIGQQTKDEERSKEPATTVTVAVKPEEAEKLAAARSEGQVMLALRNVRDEQTYETRGFSTWELVKVGLAKRPRGTSEHAAAQSSDANQDQSSGALASDDGETETPKPAKPIAAPPPEPPPPKYVSVQLIQAEDVSEVKFQSQ